RPRDIEKWHRVSPSGGRQSRGRGRRFDCLPSTPETTHQEILETTKTLVHDEATPDRRGGPFRAAGHSPAEARSPLLIPEMVLERSSTAVPVKPEPRGSRIRRQPAQERSVADLRKLTAVSTRRVSKIVWPGRGWRNVRHAAQIAQEFVRKILRATASQLGAPRIGEGPGLRATLLRIAD